jgi:hypothetical protein
MISGIINRTQYENITSPQNNLELHKHKHAQGLIRWSRVPIYTNCKGNYVDIRGDDDVDGDVAIKDDEDTFPHAKGVPMAILVSIYPWRQPRSSRIRPLLEEKRALASIVSSENYVKIMA